MTVDYWRKVTRIAVCVDMFCAAAIFVLYTGITFSRVIEKYHQEKKSVSITGNATSNMAHPSTSIPGDGDNWMLMGGIVIVGTFFLTVLRTWLDVYLYAALSPHQPLEISRSKAYIWICLNALPIPLEVIAQYIIFQSRVISCILTTIIFLPLTIVRLYIAVIDKSLSPPVKENIQMSFSGVMIEK